jgi:hypothetical protein
MSKNKWHHTHVNQPLRRYHGSDLHVRAGTPMPI